MAHIKEFITTLGPKTARAYSEDIADFSHWFDGANGQVVTPCLVTAVDLREYQSHMLAVRGLKPSTVNRRIAAIRAWLRWAKGAGHIQDSPRFPRWIAIPQVAPKALEKVEEARYLRMLERAGCLRDHALVALMLYAGLRVGEAVKVKVDEVHIGERKGRVVVRSGKGMKRREIPLGAEARSMVRPWLCAVTGEWLLPGIDGHLSTRAAQEAVRKYAYLAHLEVTPHVLRHTFATRLLRSGVDIVTVAALLGHARIDTTARYTQPKWSDLEKAVENYHD